jgi:hypothetical protein
MHKSYVFPRLTVPIGSHLVSDGSRHPINRWPKAGLPAGTIYDLGRNFQGSPALSDANPDPAAYSVLGRIIPVGPLESFPVGSGCHRQEES